MATVLSRRRSQARLKQFTASLPQHPLRAKMLNMQSVNDTLDQVIVELTKFSRTSNELSEAIECLKEAKGLVIEHGESLIDNPSGTTDIYKTLKQIRESAKGQYDDFQSRGGGFSSGSEQFQKQKEKKDLADEKKQNKEIEKKTDADLSSQGINNCRQANGQFC